MTISAFARPIGGAIFFSLVLTASPLLAQDPFTIAVIPDTQFYSESYPSTFVAQTQWIVDNKNARNIVFATHLGDVTNRGWDLSQWANAQAAMSKLDGVLPYNVVAGNHDLMDRVEDSYTSTQFVNYYGPSHFQGQSWYGGASSSGFSSYQKVNIGGQDYLMMTLAYAASDAELQWAQNVLNANANTPTILSTHDYLGLKARGTTTETGTGNSGEAMWDKLIRKNNQVFMVLGGHYHGQNQQVSLNDQGNKVYEILSDYQSFANGGNGFLRMMTFNPDQDRVDVQTYSPTLGRNMTLADYSKSVANFSFALDFDQRFSGQPSTKTSYSWQENTSGNWSSAANWTGSLSGVPQAGNVVLNFAGSASYTTTNDGISSPFPMLVNQLNFSNTAGTVTFTSTDTISIGGPDAAITKTGAGDVTINAPIMVTGRTVVTLEKNVTFTNLITGGSDFVKEGQGTLIFSGTNGRFSDCGNIFVNAGTIRAATNDTIPSTSTLTVAAGATFDDSYDTDGDNVGGIAGAGTIIGRSGKDFSILSRRDTEFSGKLTAGTDGVVGVTTAQRQMRLNKSFEYTLTLSGNQSDFAGQVTVSEGTLSIASLTDRGQASSIGLGDVNNIGDSSGKNKGTDLVIGGSSSQGTLQYTGATANSNRVLLVNAGGAVLDITSDQANLNLTGNISGAGRITKAGIGTLTLSGTNTFTGGVAIGAGILVTDNNAASRVGSGTVQVTGQAKWVTAGAVGNAVILNQGTLETTGASVGVGALTMIDGRIVGSSPLTASSYAVRNGRVDVSLGGSGALVKSGSGTVTLAGNSSSYTGGTQIEAGKLVLDYTTNGQEKLASGSTMALAGGELVMIGHAGQDSAQTLGSVELKRGSTIRVTGNQEHSTGLALGPITRTSGSTLHVETSGNASVQVTDANAADGIFGGYATVADHWAVKDSSGHLVAFGGYQTNNDPTSWTDGHITTSQVLSESQRFSGGSLRSLRLAGSVSNTLAIEDGAVLTLSSGGLLVTSNVGTGTTTISGGQLTSGNGTDLIVHQQNVAGDTLLRSAITGNIGLTKTGDGTLILQGTNDYTGMTSVNQGLLVVDHPASVSQSSGISVSAKGTLKFTGDVAATPIDVQEGATLRGQGTFNLAFGTLSTDLDPQARLNKVGSGTLLLLGDSLKTGPMTVSGGTLKSGSAAINAASLTMANAADAVFDLGGFSYQVGSLSGGGIIGGRIELGAATLTIGSDNTSTTYAGTINGTGGMTKIGSGTLTLSGNPAFTGLLAIDDGTLVIDVATSTTMAQKIIGHGNFVKDGLGTLIFSSTGRIDTDGDITVRQGTLRLANNDSLPSFSKVNIAGGASLDASYDNSQTFGGLSGGGQFMARKGYSISLDNRYDFGETNPNYVFSGLFTAGADGVAGSTAASRELTYLRFSTAREMTFSNDANDFAGQVQIQIGTLAVTSIADRGAKSALGVGIASGTKEDLTLGQSSGMEKGRLRYLGSSAATNRIVLLNASGGAMDISNASTLLTWNGAIKGTGSFTKEGAGTLRLTAANLYTGGTFINGGTLDVTGTLATSSVTLAGQASLVYRNTTTRLAAPVYMDDQSQFTCRITQGASYAGLASTTQGKTMRGTQAILLNGVNQSGSDDAVTMLWQSRSSSTQTSLVSDVLTLSAMNNDTGSDATDPFVLSMSYDASLFDASLVQWVRLSQLSDGQWFNAVQGNLSGQARWVSGAFSDSGIAGLADDLGRFGVDVATKTVWAVVDHQGTFAAAVPEPTSLGLLALAAGACLVRRRA